MSWKTLARESEPNRNFRWYETYMVHRFHPRRIFIDAASLPWVVLCLWRHQLEIAVMVAVASGVIGVLATNRIDAGKFSRTLLGRLALLHLRTANIAIQLAGVVVVSLALWAHSVSGILAGTSLLFLGHLSGWDEFFSGRGELPEGKWAA